MLLYTLPMYRLALAAFLCSTVIVAASCAPRVNPPPRATMDAAFAASIHEGITTKEELLAKLGPPVSIRVTTDGPDSGLEHAAWTDMEYLRGGRHPLFPASRSVAITTAILRVTFTKENLVKNFSLVIHSYGPLRATSYETGDRPGSMTTTTRRY